MQILQQALELWPALGVRAVITIAAIVQRRILCHTQQLS
jgi:hypothetical protein